MDQQTQQQAKVYLLSLWENKTKTGETYLAGNLGRAKVLAFKNTRKQNEKSPDWNVYVVENPKKEEPGAGTPPTTEAIKKEGGYGATGGYIAPEGQKDEPPF